ncbi:MAG: HAD hydrolase-like protein [Candidatus Methanomethylophilaceae archaeon]|nr:HAD hydrolase-like protein [Candidatus Methanomethylophilaceae archaeon]
MKEYSLYIFDFDNTLFDTSIGLKIILDNAMQEVGLEYDHSRFPEFAGLSMEQMFDKFVVDESKRDAFYGKFMEIVRSDAYMAAEPFPETERVLRELKARGKHIAIASGKYRYKIVRLMEKYGMGDLPEAIVGYEDTDLHKPCPDPILLAMSYFDVPNGDAIYVGDGPHDPVAARYAGIDSAIVNRRNGLCPDGIPCTWEIESLGGLLHRSCAFSLMRSS